MSDTNTDGGSATENLSPRRDSPVSDDGSGISNSPSASEKSGSGSDSDRSNESGGSPRVALGRKRRLLKKRKRQTLQQRRKLFGESGDEGETAPDKPEKAKPKSSSGAASDDYDSSEDNVANEDDMEFIDSRGDDHELLAEYAKETQSFRDERRPAYARKKMRDSEDISGEVRVRGGRKKMMLTDEQKRQMVRKILADMFTAAIEDIRLRAANKPAVAKLRLLPEVQNAVANTQLHEFLLEGTVLGADSSEGSETILKAFYEWLRPLPGTNLPALHLRENVLQMIVRLNISVDHLKASNLGPILYALMSHPEETEKNKALLKRMIEGFSRKIYGRSTSIREGRSRALEIQEKIGIVTPAGSTTSAPNMKLPGASASESIQLNPSPIDSLLGDDLPIPQETEQETKQSTDVSITARIPQPLVMDYVRMPSSSPTNAVVPLVPIKNRESAASQLNQRLKALRRTARRS